MPTHDNVDFMQAATASKLVTDPLADIRTWIEEFSSYAFAAFSVIWVRGGLLSRKLDDISLLTLKADIELIVAVYVTVCVEAKEWCDGIAKIK